MLKEAIEKILEIAPFHTVQIGKDTYSDRELVRVAPHVDRPLQITVNSLESIAKLVREEWDKLNTTVFIQVHDTRKVSVFTTYGPDFQRNDLYQAICDSAKFEEGYRPQQEAIIELRSKFVQNEGTEYLLSLLSRITSESSVTTADNGVTQKVEAKQGVALLTTEALKPRVKLMPYRTFLEVEQPESEFLLRINKEGRVGLFEADGGMWSMKAKANIKAYFEQSLSDMAEAGQVIVMM